ncbi:sodium:solute symporter [Lampropedia aestuarii]|uniref:Sodium:solute symporter n=1 Tax=Lampropedia aestuarii TaxID=2562762 RepID=A0A4V3YWM4_9BURK|nr:sodium:solute symporter [Lampropedia aestuarii]THJ31852.1 sodium:solute symporter [Lampropedia aestuarii]
MASIAPLSFQAGLLWLVLFAALFALAGMAYARRQRDNLEQFIVARGSQGSIATTATLMASALGAWILFSPPQAATWGGIAAVVGYALGSMSPRLAMMPLGQRMRELIPQGHSLNEFVIARYGKVTYLLTLVVMLFYMFIAMTAEITAMALLITLVAPVPLWLTAAIVMGFTLLYTAYGGLRASIFTDKVQIVLIVPVLLCLMAVGWWVTGGVAPVVERLSQTAPQLLDWSSATGIKAGVTFFVAILLTEIFHQGNWQRVYSARNTRDMRRGFLLGGVLVGPFILAMGMFGLAFMAFTPQGDSSVALFNLIMPSLPLWLVVALIPLGLALVMSSADTVISAVSSIVAVDVGRLYPQVSTAQLMRLSKWLILLLAIPVMVVAAQGYSVLYLFLLADLLCAAAAFPVFFGMYNRRHDGFDAALSMVCGLTAGLWMFPLPGEPMTTLLEAFLLAALVPVAVVGLLQLVRKQRQLFDWSALARSIRRMDHL